MRRNDTKRIALAGILAALAVVIMCLGGLIPVATYVCPMLCCMTQLIVFGFCGKRLAWTWYAVVSILSLLMSPDKEAAFVFLALGYYPLIKFSLEKRKFSPLLKALFFNGSVMLTYTALIHLMGMHELAEENMELGYFGLLLILVLGNVTFFILDRLLTIAARKIR